MTLLIVRRENVQFMCGKSEKFDFDVTFDLAKCLQNLRCTNNENGIRNSPKDHTQQSVDISSKTVQMI